MYSEKVKRDSVTVKRGCRGGGVGRNEKAELWFWNISLRWDEEKSNLDRREEIELVNSGNTPRKEQTSGNRGQNGGWV